MKYNPFRPNSIVTPGMFKGRLDEINSVLMCLNQASFGNPQHFIIDGERGVGKSSLLLMIQSFASGKIPFEDEKKLNFLVLNVELNSNSDFIDILRLISSELKNGINRSNELKSRLESVWDFLNRWEVLGVRYHKDQQTQNLQPYVILDQLVNTLKETIEKSENLDGILILIDEADKPDASASLGEILKLITEKLTKLNCDRVLFGLAGLPILMSKLRDSHESSVRIFHTITLKPLSQADSNQVIDSALNDANDKNKLQITSIDDKAKNFLSQLSEGYPHFLQEFGFAAFNTDQDNVISIEDVLGGALNPKTGAIAQLGSKYFNEMYFDQINSEDYRKVLQAMANYLDEWVDRQKIKTHLPEIKDSTMNNALQALKTRNIILNNSAKQGEYRLPSKSFAVWIKAQEKVEVIKAGS